MKKRVIGLLFTFTLLFSIGAPAVTSEQTVMQHSQLEIEQQVDAAMAVVENQIADWDKGYKSAYREIITANIEYRVLGAVDKAGLTYTFKDGGIVKYQYTDTRGDTYFVTAVLLAEEDTEDLIYEIARAHVDDKLSTVLSLVIGPIPTVGIVTSFYNTYASDLDWQIIVDIDDAGRVAQMISMLREGDDITHDTVGGWYTCPDFTTHADAHYVSVQDF